MKISSDFTQDEAFRPYKIIIHVESKDDQNRLCYFLECGQRAATEPTHSGLYAKLLEQLED